MRHQCVFLASVFCFFLYTTVGQEEVAQGSTVIFNCSDFIVDGRTPIDWFEYSSSTRTVIMRQVPALNFTDIFPTRYTDRLTVPKWGVCQLNSISTEDAEHYVCEQLFPSNNRQKSFKYTIVVTPQTPTLRVSKGSVPPGASVMFTCEPEQNTKGTLTFSFTRTDGNDINGSLVNQTAGTVTIQQASSSHTGNYTCSVKNVAGESPISPPVSLQVTLETTTVVETTTAAETTTMRSDSTTGADSTSTDIPTTTLDIPTTTPADIPTTTAADIPTTTPDIQTTTADIPTTTPDIPTTTPDIPTTTAGSDSTGATYSTSTELSPSVPNQAPLIAGTISGVAVIVAIVAFTWFEYSRRRKNAKVPAKTEIHDKVIFQLKPPTSRDSGDSISFRFSDFCAANHLTEETCVKLIRESLTTKDALSAMEERHFQMLGLTVGQDALLARGIKSLKDKEGDATKFDAISLTSGHYEEIDPFSETPNEVPGYEKLQRENTYVNKNATDAGETTYQKLTRD